MHAELKGRFVPNVTFTIKENSKKTVRSSSDLFKGKRVILFAVPGAFTLVCSLIHLPEYEEYYDLFINLGIDDIYCLAVNDLFVMEEWAKNTGTNKVKMIPDVHGTFTKALQMEVSKDELGLRSWRYAMIIDDGVIEEVFIEPSLQSISRSRAKTLLRHLNPEIILPKNILIFTIDGCSHCAKAKELLINKELFFREKTFAKDYNLSDLKALTGKTSVPQIFINGRLIGGEEELALYFNPPIETTDEGLVAIKIDS